MPYKVGKKTSQGWPILKKEIDSWVVVGHSDSKEKAQKSIQARYITERKKKNK